MMDDDEFIELMATCVLKYEGFLETSGTCNRCGKAPTTGNLHRFKATGISKRMLLEVGPVCLMGEPTTGDNWRFVLTKACENETDAARKATLQENLDQIEKPRR